jgi:hypothetical protein
LEELQDFCDTNLKALECLEDCPAKINLKASILSHKANRADSLGEPESAISLNLEAYELRLQEDPRKENLLAFFENNLGFNYGSFNDHETSLQWYLKSRDRWLAMLRDQGQPQIWPAFMRANTARAMVYLNDLSGASNLLTEAIVELESQIPPNWAWLAK